ncbi:heme-binding protein [Microbacterium sp. NPDC058389]|uniref:heme-binding protein n=1 Tax=Microbacterium sp. NPDC058389 TaxID=3346475 RepID=UPI00365C7BFD
MTHPLPYYNLALLEAEPRARFDSFTRDDAAALGIAAAQIIREWGLSLMADVHIGDELAFRVQYGQTGEGSLHWVSGKRRVVRKFSESSLLVRFRGIDTPHLVEGLGDEYAVWGGGVPIFVGDELAATLTTSGEEDVVDHEVAVTALARFAAQDRALSA